MGYTHYFRRSRNPTLDQWNQITTAFNALRIHALLTNPVHIQLHDDDEHPPIVDSGSICFNGRGDDGHETLFVERINTENNWFCKTAGKPYDFMVVALLILMNHFAPGVWDILSDGDAKDWIPVLNWMNTLGMGEYSLPLGIDN